MASTATIRKYRPKSRGKPSQGWKTFLQNHAGSIAAMDFFVVPTVTFRLLYVLIIMHHDRRKVVHFNITESPSAAWTAQQIVEALFRCRRSAACSISISGKLPDTAPTTQRRSGTNGRSAPSSHSDPPQWAFSCRYATFAGLSWHASVPPHALEELLFASTGFLSPTRFRIAHRSTRPIWDQWQRRTHHQWLSSRTRPHPTSDPELLLVLVNTVSSKLLQDSAR